MRSMKLSARLEIYGKISAKFKKELTLTLQLVHKERPDERRDFWRNFGPKRGPKEIFLGRFLDFSDFHSSDFEVDLMGIGQSMEDFFKTTELSEILKLLQFKTKSLDESKLVNCICLNNTHHKCQIHKKRCNFQFNDRYHFALQISLKKLCQSLITYRHLKYHFYELEAFKN